MHGLLYLITLLVPVYGFLRMTAKDRVTNFFAIGIPDRPATRALHRSGTDRPAIAAALWHHFVVKDATSISLTLCCARRAPRPKT